MKTFAQLKQEARGQLQGNFGTAIGAMIFASLLVWALFLPFSILLDAESSLMDYILYHTADILITILSSLLTVGLSYIGIQFAKGEKARIRDIFHFVRRPNRIILAYLAIMGIGLICMLPVGILATVLLVTLDMASIPVLVLLLLLTALLVLLVLLRYSFVSLLMADYDDMGVREALKTSARLMQGNKLRFVGLSLSFLGWFLLGFLSFGLGFLWIDVYYRQTGIAFYMEVKRVKNYGTL